MIVKMKHLDLICVAADGEATLERLRALGVVHLDLASAQGAGVAKAQGEAADAEKAVRLIRKARESVEGEVAAKGLAVADVLALDREREGLTAAADELRRTIRAYEPYGDFDPELVKKIRAAGVDLSGVVELPERLPEMRLGEMKAKFGRLSEAIRRDTEKIAACDEKAILAQYPEIADRIAFEEAKELLTNRGAVSFISGWIPVSLVGKLKGEVAKAGWGILLRDPTADETPPTLIEPPRLFRPVKALFDGLGVVPAYTEADVSVPFMCYFSLFFAMLVGDGAYGAIFLAATLWGWKKTAGNRSPIARSWLILLTVFSLATIAWGTLSDTWFGAQIPFCRDWVTVQWLGDVTYRNMMFLCFTIGVSHLMLARIWNGVCKINDSTCVAEFGWAGILLFMYFVTNSIVGVFAGIPKAMYVVFALSLIAVFGFTLKPSEFKSRGAELGLLPLNIMSALGDIISYVRLFAVGLASVKVAENFNAMATGLFADPHAWWVTALMGLGAALILIIGHGLNLAMAGLSILVHAVRLNTLEFSNHKGVTWSGYMFAPFKRQATKI